MKLSCQRPGGGCHTSFDAPRHLPLLHSRPATNIQVCAAQQHHRSNSNGGSHGSNNNGKSTEAAMDEQGQEEAEKLLAYRQRLRFGFKPDDSDNLSRTQPRQAAVAAAARPRRRWALGSYWAAAWANFKGKTLYNYYNWRKGTTGDLQLIVALNVGLALLLGLVRRHLIDDEVMRHAGNFWSDLYQVAAWIFGQDFPGADAPLAQQVFSVVSAMMGLTAFALVLALMEQVVLETMDANVEKGSPVFERGHIVILSWGRSQRDIEVVRKILQQVCIAYKPEGGTTLVVLSQRPKLDMEALFWRCLPAAQRHGTRLVFRQGSALIPADLKLVSAFTARAAVIVSDQSRGAAEADAQSLRCAILLDELDHSCADSLPDRYTVVELKTSNSLPLLKYACSKRVMAVPTGQMNAQRLAKMVKRPVISIISQQLFNFEHKVTNYTQAFPELAGCRFGELAFRFADAIVLGVTNNVTGQTLLNPPNDYEVQAADSLVLCRPTSIASDRYHPLPEPLQFDSFSSQTMDEDESYVLLKQHQSQHSRMQYQQPSTNNPAAMLPHDGKASANLHHNERTASPTAQATATAVTDAPTSASISHTQHSASTSEALLAAAAHTSLQGQPQPNSSHPSDTIATQQQPAHMDPATHVAHVTDLIPPEFLRVDDEPQRVLVAGWGQKSFMADLLKELDHGGSCLPPGSEVVFVNAHDPDSSLGEVLHTHNLENVSVRHIRADPLLRGPLHKIDWSGFRCALVLCDEQWVDPDLDDSNGIDNMDEPSVLRLDSLVMVVQLNIRKVLEDQALPPINMIAQKCAAEGLTRFEDRHRLPLGICVNLTSFAAKMLTQVAFNPSMLSPLTKLGEGTDLTIVDASCYSRRGEAVAFWELMARAQQARDVLVGYYAIPEELDQALESVVNPIGHEARSQRRVWNNGDGRVKFIVLRHKSHSHTWSSGSHDDLELQTTQQAQWVQMRSSNNGVVATSSNAAGSSNGSHNGSSGKAASSSSSGNSSSGGRGGKAGLGSGEPGRR